MLTLAAPDAITRDMFRLASSAFARLSPEAANVAEQFLRALPPYAMRRLRSVRLYGSQARRFDPDMPFDLLIVVDERSLEVKTAIAIATNAVQADGVTHLFLTVASEPEVADPTPPLARALANARREGVDLWVRPEAPAMARLG